LTANTVKIYLGALKGLTELKNQLIHGGGEVLERGLLRGYANLSSHDRLAEKTTTTPVDIPLLLSIKAGIGKMGWAKGSALCLWSACLVAFWGAFRLGEIFPKEETRFDRHTNLLWGDVNRSADNKVVIKVRGGKIPGPPGNRVRLFALKEKMFCPVAALASLEDWQRSKNLWRSNLPVFRRSSGRNLTKYVFLKAVNASLRTQTGNGTTLSGKSFRSGIPSCLENFPESFQENHLKSLGRWKGQAYQRYMRNDDPEFQWVFREISDRLLTNVSSGRKTSDQAEANPDPQQR
jgi:hypothetical protein